MDNRQTILNRIYKTCFCNEYIRDAFQRNWRYIYDFLSEGDEDMLSDEILHYIDLWMDAM